MNRVFEQRKREATEPTCDAVDYRIPLSLAKWEAHKSKTSINPIRGMTLFDHIKNVLSEEEAFCKEGQLFKNTVVEAGLRLDPALLSLLLKDPKAKKHFFSEVEGIAVFDKVKFQKFISNKQFLPDSFTAYKNKIGLTAKGEYLTEANEVVLDFPYKDCVLEGGQTKEDQKRQEIFWNQTLAPDEIDRLFEPKVLSNFKRYSQRGEEEVSSVSDKDNLIIKGNNLIALHSLKKVFADKVKLIYIDPPYNTGSDSFGYNDSFNHSTWLTFMKNRLEVARHLLSKDGVILVQCSFHEFAYLKILMTDIFEKHLCDFNIQVRHPDRVLTGDKEYNDVIEYIIIFSKNKSVRMPFKEKVKTVENYTIHIEIKDKETPHKILELDGKPVDVYLPNQYKVLKKEPSKDLLKRISISGSIREKNSSGRFFVKHLESLDYPPETLFSVPNMGDDAQPQRYFYKAPKGKKNGGYYQGMPASSSTTKEQYSNFYNFVKEYNRVAKQGGVSFRNGKKPEELIQFLISIFSQENDIVLDYHLGSGTTAATAHKLNRRYIGIEQMDYVQTLAVERLKQVIEGEQTGISQAIGWSGGGEFIYAELLEYSNRIVNDIFKAETDTELISIWDKLKNSSLISYRFNSTGYNDLIKQLEELDINSKKKLLISIIDKNQLYVNLSDSQDTEYKIPQTVKTLNNQFYLSGAGKKDR